MDQLSLTTIFLTLSGLFLTSIGIIAIIDGLESKNWKKVKGTILSDVHFSDLSIDRGSKNKSSVQYKYTFENKEYTSNKITTSSKFFSSFHLITNKDLMGYKTGMDVDVYINPQDENDSVLKPGVQTPDVIHLIIGVIVLSINLIQLIS